MSAKATEVTHFLFESKPLWSGRIGAAGVSDAAVQTIPLEAATNLINGNAYIIRIGRVDANGVKRAQNLTEVTIGKLSGTNFINCVRGSEGTAQEFAAGTVVEVLFTSTHWDKLIEFLGVEHGPTGVHTSALVTTLKATGAEINTGIEDAKIVTPKAIADSNVSTASKTETLTNKTLTLPKLNEDVAVTTSATELNLIDGLTSSAAELNALDGQMGAWTAYTPNLTNITLGTGTLTFAYIKIGKIVFVRGFFRFNTGSSITGAMNFSLPVNANANATGTTFPCTILDQGTAYFQGQVFISGNNITIQSLTTGSTYLGPLNTSSTVPMTWANDDQLYFALFYEAA